MLQSRRSILPLILSLCSLGLAGCGSSHSLPSQLSTSAFADLSGNWTIAPQAAPGEAQLPAASGSLTSQGNAVSGIFRLNGPSGCFAPATNLVLSGEMSSTGKLTLASAPIAGATWSLQGQIAPGGRSITNATYSVKGGACPETGGSAGGTQYTPISGVYAGTFTDGSGGSTPVSTTLTQTSAPDANGQFHLSGTANFAENPCFTSPAVTDSLVTGNSLSASYSQTNGGVTTTVTASGTFNTDATTLTITSSSIQGGACDGDSGTGVLTKQ